MSLISPQNAQYLIEHLSDLSKGTDISRTSLARIENVIRAAGGMDSTVPSDPLQRPKYFFLPGLTAKPFWEPSQFEWVAALEAQYETIKSELLARYSIHRESRSAFPALQLSRLRIPAVPM